MNINIMQNGIEFISKTDLVSGLKFLNAILGPQIQKNSCSLSAESADFQWN